MAWSRIEDPDPDVHLLSHDRHGATRRPLIALAGEGGDGRHCES